MGVRTAMERWRRYFDAGYSAGREGDQNQKAVRSRMNQLAAEVRVAIDFQCTMMVIV